MAAYTGVGTRIRERMLKLGYERADGEPDVQRFSWDFRYDRTLIYAWLADKATPFKDLIRLARDLQISVEWLLTGEDRLPKASRRQGRRTAGSLVLALLAGAASLLGFGPPSGRGVVEAAPLHPAYIIRREDISSGFSLSYFSYTVSLIRRRSALWLWNCTVSPVAA